MGLNPMTCCEPGLILLSVRQEAAVNAREELQRRAEEQAAALTREAQNPGVPRHRRRARRLAGSLLRTGLTAAASLAAAAAVQARQGGGGRSRARTAVQLPAWFPGAA